jgi:hypothetical protein
MRYLKTYEQLNYGTSIDIGGVIVYPFHTIGNLVNIPGGILMIMSHQFSQKKKWKL